MSPPRNPRSRHRKHRARRKRRMSAGVMQWWLLWRVPVLFLIVLILWWVFFRPLAMHAEEWSPVSHRFDICGERGRAHACVTDGDTVTLGYGQAARRIRLTGFDAPEIEGACPAETERALAAQQGLRNWLNGAPFEWSGGAEPPRDTYSRELRAVRRIGADGKVEYLAETMIAAGLAGETGWGAREVDWCL